MEVVLGQGLTSVPASRKDLESTPQSALVEGLLGRDREWLLGQKALLAADLPNFSQY